MSGPLSVIFHLRMSTTSFWAAIIVVVLIYFLFIRYAIFRANLKNSRHGDDGWHVPTIDAGAKGNSIFHRWDVRFKICAILFYCLATAFLYQILPALTALTGAVISLYIAKIPIKRIQQRVSALCGFLSMFLLVMPLTAANIPGDQLIIIDPYNLFFNLRAFQKAVVIIIKACTIALMMEPLFSTAPLAVTVDGMRRLGLPTVICQMLLLSHRYIFVFLHEVKRMSTSMRLRGFRKRSNLETLRVMGNFVGMLLVRSVDRTERVYQAMLARGFQGSFPVYHEYRTNWHDWLKLIIFMSLGLLFILLDQIV